MYYSDTSRKKLMSTSLPRKCMGWNKTEFHTRNDHRAFVVKTPSGMSTALLSYRTINLEELSIKLRNWNLFWFATFPNKQMPGARRKLIPIQAQTDFLCLHFVSKQDIFFFSRSSFFFITISEHTTSLPCDGISFAISHSSWLANTR